MVQNDKLAYFNDLLMKGENLEPIFTSKDNKILDGHHRMISCYKNEKPVLCIKLYLDFADAARMLNKVQDRYNWENGLDDKQFFKIADILSAFGDEANAIEDPEFQTSGESIEQEEPIDNIEEELLNSTEQEGNKTILIGYRMKPLQKNSKTGHIFSLEPKDKFKHRFELEFDNLLFVEADKIKDMSLPTESLAKEWFPESNLKLLAIEDNTNYETFINELVCEKAKEMGYDGIVYDNKILQAIETK